MAISVAMLINVPIMIGLMLLPDLVMVVLFGDKWLPAAPILAVLALSGLLYPLHSINLQVLLAQGGSRTFFHIEVAKKLIGIVCVGVGSVFGIYGLAWGQVVASFIALALNAGPARRSLGYGPFRQLWDLRGIFFCSLVMGAVVWTGMVMLTLSPLPKLCVLVLGGAVTYFVVGFSLKLGSFREALDISRLIVGGNQTAGAEDSARTEAPGGEHGRIKTSFGGTGTNEP